MYRRRAGVTLIELMTVIVILGVLAAIAIPRLWLVRERSYRSAVQSDLRSFASQQELFHDRNLQYAASTAELVEFQASPGVTVQVTSANETGWAATGIHSGLPFGQCGLYYGTASAGAAPPASTPGVVACN